MREGIIEIGRGRERGDQHRHRTLQAFQTKSETRRVRAMRCQGGVWHHSRRGGGRVHLNRARVVMAEWLDDVDGGILDAVALAPLGGDDGILVICPCNAGGGIYKKGRGQRVT